MGSYLYRITGPAHIRKIKLGAEVQDAAQFIFFCRSNDCYRGTKLQRTLDLVTSCWDRTAMPVPPLVVVTHVRDAKENPIPAPKSASLHGCCVYRNHRGTRAVDDTPNMGNMDVLGWIEGEADADGCYHVIPPAEWRAKYDSNTGILLEPARG